MVLWYRDGPRWTGLSIQATQTIQGAWVGSITAYHKAKCLGFQQWSKCEKRGWTGGSFQQCLLDRVLSHDTIKLYTTTISSCHEDFGDRPLVSRETESRQLWAPTSLYLWQGPGSCGLLLESFFRVPPTVPTLESIRGQSLCEIQQNGYDIVTLVRYTQVEPSTDGPCHSWAICWRARRIVVMALYMLGFPRIRVGLSWLASYAYANFIYWQMHGSDRRSAISIECSRGLWLHLQNKGYNIVIVML